MTTYKSVDPNYGPDEYGRIGVDPSIAPPVALLDQTPAEGGAKGKAEDGAKGKAEDDVKGKAEDDVKGKTSPATPAPPAK